MQKFDNDTLAKHFRALSHPRRVGIYRLLSARPEVGRSLSSLQQATRLCESSLTHHLREMERCGLIRRRRKGAYMTFRLETVELTSAVNAALQLGAISFAQRQQAA